MSSRDSAFLDAKRGAGRVTFMGKSLRNPALDIHYNARQGGQNFAPKQKLPYALVVTVHAKHLGDLYDRVIRKYAGRLEVFETGD